LIDERTVTLFMSSCRICVTWRRTVCL